MDAAATYLYCVVKHRAAQKLGRVPKGLAGAGKPRLVDVGDGFSIVAADAPLALYDAGAIDAKLRDIEWVGARAAEHEAVVEHAARLGTVVPMKLFTLFTNDDRAAAHVKKMKRSLDRVVERIAGCEEWGIRVLLDEKRARATQKPVARPKTGTSFLLRKKALDDERRSSEAGGVAEAEELFARLSTIARRAQRRPAPNRELAGRVFLDAVFLVPHAKVARLKAAVDKAAKPLVAQGFDITLSGPWPAYSFIAS